MAFDGEKNIDQQKVEKQEPLVCIYCDEPVGTKFFKPDGTTLARIELDPKKVFEHCPQNLEPGLSTHKFTTPQ